MNIEHEVESIIRKLCTFQEASELVHANTLYGLTKPKTRHWYGDDIVGDEYTLEDIVRRRSLKSWIVGEMETYPGNY